MILREVFYGKIIQERSFLCPQRVLFFVALTTTGKSLPKSSVVGCKY
jgi:hypothetical protein